MYLKNARFRDEVYSFEKLFQYRTNLLEKRLYNWHLADFELLKYFYCSKLTGIYFSTI